MFLNTHSQLLKVMEDERMHKARQALQEKHKGMFFEGPPDEKMLIVLVGMPLSISKCGWRRNTV